MAEIPGLIEWFSGRDTGMSSMCMARYLSTGTIERRDYPMDPADLGRCERLLRAIPTLRPLLPQMANVSPIWAALVARWDDLIELCNEEVPGCFTSRTATGWAPRTYALMRELQCRSDVSE